MKKISKIQIIKIIISIAIPLLIYIFVILFIDSPLTEKQVIENKDKRALIAIRDNVISFQKWGSMFFTLSQVNKTYKTINYFTQSANSDRKNEFIYSLIILLKNYQSVDIFLLAHSNKFYEWIETIPEKLRKKIRLVYNTGCGNASQAEKWIKIGAKTYIGHLEYSASPIFYFYFLRRWVRGYSSIDAMNISNIQMQKILKNLSLFYNKKAIEQIWNNTKPILLGSPLTNIRS